MGRVKKECISLHEFLGYSNLPEGEKATKQQTLRLSVKVIIWAVLTVLLPLMAMASSVVALIHGDLSAVFSLAVMLLLYFMYLPLVVAIVKLLLARVVYVADGRKFLAISFLKEAIELMKKWER